MAINSVIYKLKKIRSSHPKTELKQFVVADENNFNPIQLYIICCSYIIFINASCFPRAPTFPAFVLILCISNNLIIVQYFLTLKLEFCQLLHELLNRNCVGTDKKHNKNWTVGVCSQLFCKKSEINHCTKVKLTNQIKIH